jgi:predicted XRE-type DNA-binding protein
MRATKGSENVFVDCGFPPAEAENLRIRAKMMMALTSYIQERKITQSCAARIIGVSQPRKVPGLRGGLAICGRRGSTPPGEARGAFLLRPL